MRAVLILVGPSGVGKTTVADEIISRYSDFKLVRSATTRRKRGDAYDSEYIYLSGEQFSKMVSDGEMLEHMVYGENMYGTPSSEIQRIFAEGKVPLLILDINGVKSFREGNFGFRSVIFYLYDDINIIEQRLYDRYLKNDPGADNFFSFLSRKNANRRDYREMRSIASLFDKFLKNETVIGTADAVYDSFNEILSDKALAVDERDGIAQMLSDSVI